MPVKLTKGLVIPDDTYIDGNGHKIEIKLSEPSDVGVKMTGNGKLTLDNVKLTIDGEQQKSIDGMYINGEVEVTGNSSINISNLRTGILSGNTDSKMTVDAGSSLRVYNVTGNGTQSINWTVSGTVEFDQCESYGMSVESLTTEGGSISVKNVKYGAIYAVDSIHIGKDTTVTIDTCGNGLPRTSDFGNCYAPIQIKVLSSGAEDDASITIDSGATVTIKDCKNNAASPKDINNIYVPEGVEYTNNGTLNGKRSIPGEYI